MLESPNPDNDGVLSFERIVQQEDVPEGSVFTEDASAVVEYPQNLPFLPEPEVESENGTYTGGGFLDLDVKRLATQVVRNLEQEQRDTIIRQHAQSRRDARRERLGRTPLYGPHGTESASESKSEPPRAIPEPTPLQHTQSDPKDMEPGILDLSDAVPVDGPGEAQLVGGDIDGVGKDALGATQDYHAQLVELLRTLHGMVLWNRHELETLRSRILRSC